MKLGCSSWSYHAAFRDGRIDLRDWIRTCGDDLELDGVELVDTHFATTDPLYLRDVKKLCTDMHLNIAALAVINDFGPDATRATETARVQQWCDVAAYLGVPVVRAFAGRVPLQQHDADAGRLVGLFRRVFGAKPVDRRRLWSDVMWAVRRCTDHAAERGIVLALQNSRPDGIAGTTTNLLQALRDVGSPWLGVSLDPADLDDRTGIETVLARTAVVRARMHDVRDDGSDRDIHWPVLLRALSLSRYRGFVLIDYDGEEQAETAVPRAAAHLRGALHLLARQQLLSPPDADVISNGTSAVEEAKAAIVEAQALR